jgi:hypothetical protein
MSGFVTRGAIATLEVLVLTALDSNTFEGSSQRDLDIYIKA